MLLTAGNRSSGYKLVPATHCPQFRHRLPRNRTRTSANEKPMTNPLIRGTAKYA